MQFCYRVGMDYVSCSPYRVPIARLAAAQAAISGDKSEAQRTASHIIPWGGPRSPQGKLSNDPLVSDLSPAKSYSAGQRGHSRSRRSESLFLQRFRRSKTDRNSAASVSGSMNSASKRK